MCDFNGMHDAHEHLEEDEFVLDTPLIRGFIGSTPGADR